MLKTMPSFVANDRQYKETSWMTSKYMTALEYMTLSNLDPLENKLISGDEYDFKERTVIRNSPFRTKLLPGILVTSGNTYGRVKSKLLYKCIPNDKSLPVFLVPYQEKNSSFNKNKIDKFVLFVFDSWEEKHPRGILRETLGEVSEINAFEEHQMNCKDINHSIQKFSKTAYKAVRKKTSQKKDIIEDIMKTYKIEDRTDEEVISIDPPGCTDIDDAFSIKFDDESPWKTTISIYIANVPLWFDYLDIWDDLDRRVSTVYLTSERRSMLPSILSENLCSLKEGQRRFAIAMDIFIMGTTVREITFRNALIKVAKNYSYDDQELKENNVYREAEILSNKINSKYAYIDEISDSHDVVQMFMIMMNNNIGRQLRDEIGKGIYRSFKSAPVDEIMQIPSEMKDFARTWKSEGGVYTTDGTTGHDMMKRIDVYAHSTSPIRRLVDLVNMTLLTNSLNIVGEKGLAFADKWIEKLDYINSQMKSTRKVQNDVKLLVSCLNIDDLADRRFEGYIIDIEKEDSSTMKYTVLLKELSCISSFKTQDQYDLYDKGYYSLHIFNDEYNLKQKIRVSRLHSS